MGIKKQGFTPLLSPPCESYQTTELWEQVAFKAQLFQAIKKAEPAPIAQLFKGVFLCNQPCFLVQLHS